MTASVLNFWNLVPVTLLQGLLYAFIALAVMIPSGCCRFLISRPRGAFR